jgi:hypothetical protein
MIASHFSFPAVTRWLLVSVLSAVLPAMGADALPTALPDIVRGSALELAVLEPGTLASPGTTASPGGASASPGTLANQDTTPQSVVQQPADQIPATPAQVTRHHSRWVWVAVIAGIAAGAGAAIVVTNRQSGRTSTTIPGATVNVGGPSAGAP